MTVCGLREFGSILISKQTIWHACLVELHKQPSFIVPQIICNFNLFRCDTSRHAIRVNPHNTVRRQFDPWWSFPCATQKPSASQFWDFMTLLGYLLWFHFRQCSIFTTMDWCCKSLMWTIYFILNVLRYSRSKWVFVDPRDSHPSSCSCLCAEPHKSNHGCVNSIYHFVLLPGGFITEHSFLLTHCCRMPLNILAIG